MRSFLSLYSATAIYSIRMGETRWDESTNTKTTGFLFFKERDGRVTERCINVDVVCGGLLAVLNNPGRCNTERWESFVLLAGVNGYSHGVTVWSRSMHRTTCLTVPHT